MKIEKSPDYWNDKNEIVFEGKINLVFREISFSTEKYCVVY